MRSLCLRWLLAIVVVPFCSLLPVAAAEPGASIPVEDFYRRPLVQSPTLSPSGKMIAMLVPSTAKDGRVTLAVAPSDAPNKLVAIAHLGDADVRSFSWVNDGRLVLSAVDFQSAMSEQYGSGLYAVNADGTDFTWLVARMWGDQDNLPIHRRPLRVNHRLVKTLNDGSDDVIVERYELRRRYSEIPSTSLLRLNTRTRGLTEFKMPAPPQGAQDWVLDRSAFPQPRALRAIVKDEAAIYWRDDKGGDWVELARYKLFGDGAKDAFVPHDFDAAGNLYVVATRDNPEQTSALYRYDVAKRQIEPEPVVALKGFDFEGSLIFDRGSRRLLGVSHLTDARGVDWFDPTLKALQAKVDKQLPATINILCGSCVSTGLTVVRSYSDRQTGLFFLYDVQADKLKLIGASRPWLDAARMAEVDFDRVTVRDGMSVPVYVTRPKGKGPWPAVVLVHGGPYVRGGEWEWKQDAQFLASRGYLVIEPEARGSTGFGDKHFRAGWKQWGLAMQDDITDVTRWAIKKGLADEKRIALAGASYGGYATMMGLAKEPELYRAGINWVGVTDINLMYDVGWSDFAGSDWELYGMPRLVGDQEKDAAQLVATSPLKQAARITKPVLMAYGGMDFRVPLPHGTKMHDALKSLGKVEVEWVEYPTEGHGWMLVENDVDFWKRVERFLARHLQ